MNNLLKQKIDQALKTEPQKKALVSASGNLTREELYFIAEKNSAVIQNVFDSSEYVPLLFLNPFQFTLAVYSVWFAGKIPVPLNPTAGKEELTNILGKLKTGKIISDFPDDRELFSDGNEAIPWDKLKEIKAEKSTVNSFSNTAVVIFTSGSTGVPKGVPISFSNLEANVNSILHTAKLTEADSWLASLPFFHIGGFAIIWRALALGSTLFLPDSFSSKEIIKTLKKFRPSVFSVVSTTLIELIDSVSPYENLKAIFAGGGPVKGELMKSAIDKGFPVFKVYGSTETVSMVTVLTPDDFSFAPESAGKPFDGIAIKIENPDADGVGEVCVKGRQITSGYLNDGGSSLTEDGFRGTGDLGYISKEGFLYIVGRKAEFIISGGENINLNKIKKALLELDEVQDAEAVGIPDRKWGEMLCAVVVPTAKINLDELKNALGKKLAKFEIPKKIIFTNEIPRTPLGKPKQAEIKKLFFK